MKKILLIVLMVYGVCAGSICAAGCTDMAHKILEAGQKGEFDTVRELAPKLAECMNAYDDRDLKIFVEYFQWELEDRKMIRPEMQWFKHLLERDCEKLNLRLEKMKGDFPLRESVSINLCGDFFVIKGERFSDTQIEEKVQNLIVSGVKHIYFVLARDYSAGILLKSEALVEKFRNMVSFQTLSRAQKE